MCDWFFFLCIFCCLGIVLNNKKSQPACVIFVLLCVTVIGFPTRLCLALETQLILQVVLSWTLCDLAKSAGPFFQMGSWWH